MRKGELLSHRRGAVEPDQRKIIVEPATEKVGKGRVIPMSAALEAQLRAASLRNCEAIPTEKKPKVTFHCLRHSAALLMAQGGASLFEIAKILGHGSLAMVMRYAHFCPQRGKSAVESIGQFLAASPAHTADGA